MYAALTPRVSEAIGERVWPLLGRSPLACLVLIYDEPGDHITWHYDVNVTNGKQITVLVPLVGDSSCAQFQYVDAREGHHRVRTPRVSLGQAAILQGDVVYHRATPQCAFQTRVVLVFEYSTSPDPLPWHAAAIAGVKRAFFL